MIPRIRIANLPTPIESLPRLTATLRGPHIWVKRDDLTGLAFGGNKTRKLEFVIAEAQANGAQTLITVGAIQSNHCRQTAALAARFGLKCILVLSGEVPASFSGNLMLDRLFGAEIIWTTNKDRENDLQRAFEKAWEDGKRPYLIPLGASNVTGSIAYVYAFEEAVSQGLNPDWIVLASSSCGTQAGLVLGAKRSGWSGHILGISIDHSKIAMQEKISALASQASERLGNRLSFTPEEILVNDDYLGMGYGVLGDNEINAIRLFAQSEGLLLDPVYTGKAAAGLIDLIEKGFFKEDETVLFWHTGGTPALFADSYIKLLL
jgi:D-cysteine desulfhydrase family pyridoxal phosphate-dependent enzyme